VTIQLISSNQIAGPCPAVWQGIWQAMDCCSNYATCTQTVTVVNTNLPVIQCPSNIVVTSCVATQVFYTVTASNLCCTNVEVVCNPVSGSSFAPGTTTTVYCTATDCCTNIATCSFTVTVLCNNQPCCPETNGVKYVQNPNLTNGIDVDATLIPDPYGWYGWALADFFPCTNSGPITDIHLWGSWLNDQVDYNAIFTLAIWSDLPIQDGIGCYPDQLLWTQSYSNGQYTLCPYTNQFESFCDDFLGPDSFGSSSNLFYLCFDVSPTNTFHQTGTLTAPTNYWLSLTVQSPGSNYFGWKSSATGYTYPNHWGAESSGSGIFPPPPGDWGPMTDFQGDLLHLAFKITTATNCVPAPTNLVLWLPFDETNGATSANLASPANHVTHVGNPTPILGAYVANSLSFNGTTTQYVTVPDYPAIEIGTNDFTIDAWVNRATNGPNSYPSVILDKRDLNTAAGYSLSVSFGRLVMTLGNASSYNNYVTSASLVPPDGLWHFIGISVSQRTSQVLFYIDGVVNSTLPITPMNISNTNSLWVGGSQYGDINGGDRHWTGGLDEVEVFNRALSTNELYTIYSAGTAGKCKPCCYLKTLTISKVTSTTVEVNWGGCGTLEESTNLLGTWTAIPNAASPYVIPITGSKMFYRLKCP
jgi:hypothetical protein